MNNHHVREQIGPAELFLWKNLTAKNPNKQVSRKKKNNVKKKVVLKPLKNMYITCLICVYNLSKGKTTLSFKTHITNVPAEDSSEKFRCSVFGIVYSTAVYSLPV